MYVYLYIYIGVYIYMHVYVCLYGDRHLYQVVVLGFLYWFPYGCVFLINFLEVFLELITSIWPKIFSNGSWHFMRIVRREQGGMITRLGLCPSCTSQSSTTHNIQILCWKSCSCYDVECVWRVIQIPRSKLNIFPCLWVKLGSFSLGNADESMMTKVL